MSHCGWRMLLAPCKVRNDKSGQKILIHKGGERMGVWKIMKRRREHNKNSKRAKRKKSGTIKRIEVKEISHFFF